MTRISQMAFGVLLVTAPAAAQAPAAAPPAPLAEEDDNILEGRLPRTADDAVDVSDLISNQGLYSQDIDWPGTTGPCATQDYTIPANVVADIRAAHTGNLIPSSGRYAGTSRGDQVARGYITVDVVTQCSTLLPNQAGYFSGVADNRNVLLGEYLFVNPAENFLQALTALPGLDWRPVLVGTMVTVMVPLSC